MALAYHAGWKWISAAVGSDSTHLRVLEVLLHKGPLPIITVGPEVALAVGEVSVATIIKSIGVAIRT